MGMTYHHMTESIHYPEYGGVGVCAVKVVVVLVLRYD